MLEYPSFEQFVGTRIDDYQVEQLLDQGKLGAIFLARTMSNGNACMLRILAIPLQLNAPVVTNSLETFQHQASTIVALQHPYILPLIGYGVLADMPYLVWPAIPVRTMSSRIAQSGPLDPVTAGRYLDQVSAALEYAHEHMVLHRSLTADTLSLQRDGRVLVQDFGVRRMLERGRKDAQWYALHNWNEACTPEQILGLPATPATDVYALGATLYQLLTGHPLYTGSSREEIAHKHLHSPIPSLRGFRSDLPVELNTLLATALAKESQQRFSQPGQLANAYHTIISPQDTARVPFNALSLELPPPSPRVQVTAAPANSAKAALTAELSPKKGAATPQRPQRRSPLQLALILGVLAALMFAGTALAFGRLQTQQTATVSGQVNFIDSNAHTSAQTDALALQVKGLVAPPSGRAYHAWMINQQSEQILALGPLIKQGQTYTLSYQDAGINLLSLGNLLEITLEQGSPDVPTGKVVLTGIFPPKSFVHVQHLLVSYPTTPGKVGLLVGAETQIILLNAQAQALNQAASNQDAATIQCKAQSILDIIEGVHGENYHSLSKDCVTQHGGTAGDGFGLLGSTDPTYKSRSGYLPEASAHAALATSQPDATANLRLHGHAVETELDTIVGWVTSLEQDALLLQKTPFAPGVLQATVQLADQAWHGTNQNGGNQAGEPGITAAYSEGQQMASLTLTANN